MAAPLFEASITLECKSITLTLAARSQLASGNGASLLLNTRISCCVGSKL
jgi:hypothetical protein